MGKGDDHNSCEGIDTALFRIAIGGPETQASQALLATSILLFFFLFFLLFPGWFLYFLYHWR